MLATLSQLQQQFWSRWSQEYLSQFQVRYKWKRATTDENKLQVDMLVVIKDN